MLKIKSIANLVNSEKKLYICSDGDTQWIGTGAAMYPINNLPYMDIPQFAKLLDIPSDTKARNKYFLSELDAGTFDFVSENIGNAEPVGMNRWIFSRGSNQFIPLITTQGLMFLDAQYLVPIVASNMRNIFECYNPDDNHHYIIVKEGLYVVAVIEPSGYVLDRDVQEELRAMLKSLDQGAYAQQAHWLVVNAVDIETSQKDEMLQLQGYEAPMLGERVIHQLEEHLDDQDDDENNSAVEISSTLEDECYLPEACRSCKWGHENPPDDEDLCGPCDFETKPPSNYVARNEEEIA